MAQAAIPAVLQDLIKEHKLFQRPEWLRLSSLERELINTLSRTDLSAGQRARLYASLTNPYKALREDILVNGVQFSNKQDKHTNRDGPQHLDLPAESETGNMDAEQIEYADESDDDDNSTTSSHISEADETLASSHGEIFDTASENEFEDASTTFSAKKILLERSLSTNEIFEKIVELLTYELQPKSEADKKNQDLHTELVIRKRSTQDFLNVLKNLDNKDSKTSFNMHNAQLVKRGIMKRDPDFFKELEENFPNMREIPNTDDTNFDPQPNQERFEGYMNVAKMNEMLHTSNNDLNSLVDAGVRGRRSHRLKDLHLDPEKQHAYVKTPSPTKKAAAAAAAAKRKPKEKTEAQTKKKKSGYERDEDYPPPKPTNQRNKKTNVPSMSNKNMFTGAVQATIAAASPALANLSRSIQAATTRK